MILKCEYEEWSPQFESNLHNPNPPSRDLRGEDRGDLLDARTANVTSQALGSHRDPLAADYSAPLFTEDSWPERRLVTAFDVQRGSLTRQNLLTARNQYAAGCSARNVPALLDAVRVSIYAPWDWQI